MSTVVIEALKRDLQRKQKRINRLRGLMSYQHIKPETAQKMDDFANRFNAANTAKEKMDIAEEWKSISEEWSGQVQRAKIQNDRYLEWMEEESKLMSEIAEISSEISIQEFRVAVRQNALHEDSD